MKNFIIGALVLFLILVSVRTQAQHGGDESAVQQVMVKVFDGLSALDMQVVKQCTTSDLIILENGMIWNLDSLTSRIAPLKSMNFSRTNHLDFKKIEVRGNTAWVYYDNFAEMKVGEHAVSKHWLESAVLIKDVTDWKIRLLHSTTIK